MSGWRKLGLLWCPTGQRHPALASHAANPLPVRLQGDVYRIFYSGRDASNRSSVGAVDIDIVRRVVVRDAFEPVFQCGPPGSFHEAGVSIGNCYRVGDTTFMLFMGWQSPPDGHWRGDIGRLVVGDDLSLRLDGTAPLMGADATDPLSLSYPWVRPDGRGRWQMWYGSTLAWDAGNGEMLHPLHHAVSDDGHRWTRTGLAVPFELGVAQAFSRPTVAAEAHGLRMWFSYRGGGGERYRIGSAFSADGQRWQLQLDIAPLHASPSGWDSDMVEYPYVFDHGADRLMLYNGSSYGRTGFGLAVLDRD